MADLPIIPQSCDGCGLCCESNGSPVLTYQSRSDGRSAPPERPSGLPQALIDEIDLHFRGLHRGQEPQGRCLWFDPAERTCRHYEWRPQVCRDYERGGVACLSVRNSGLQVVRNRRSVE